MTSTFKNISKSWCDQTTKEKAQKRKTCILRPTCQNSEKYLKTCDFKTAISKPNVCVCVFVCFFLGGMGQEERFANCPRRSFQLAPLWLLSFLLSKNLSQWVSTNLVPIFVWSSRCIHSSNGLSCHKFRTSVEKDKFHHHRDMFGVQKCHALTRRWLESNSIQDLRLTFIQNCLHVAAVFHCSTESNYILNMWNLNTWNQESCSAWWKKIPSNPNLHQSHFLVMFQHWFLVWPGTPQTWNNSIDTTRCAARVLGMGKWCVYIYTVSCRVYMYNEILYKSKTAFKTYMCMFM